MNIARWGINIFIMGLLIGCAGSPIRAQLEDGRNRSNLLQLKIGMNKEQALNIMGKPYKTEAYVVEAKNLEFWLYLTERTTGFVQPTDINFTPLAFEAGILMGWGRNFYNDVLKIQQDIKIESK